LQDRLSGDGHGKGSKAGWPEHDGAVADLESEAGNGNA
jgi:hypothetical protein